MHAAAARAFLPSHSPQRYSSSQESCVSPNCSSSVLKEKNSLDFTQRVEKKLAEYNASQNVFKRWLFELLSCLVSVLSMSAVVVIYFNLADKPVHDAGYLLTYANILGKIASAALIVPTSEALGQLKWNWFHQSNAMWDFEIFDKASRGAWGAVMLLFRTKGRSLAALGALLIVLLLAIDTFFQQVVDLPTRWTLDGTASILPRTVKYDPNMPLVYREGVDANTNDKDMFLVVEKFSYENGTQPVPFGNGTRPDIPLSCPTSNCTWPVYDTLGVCSQCEDVSAQLTYTCLDGTIDWAVNLKGGYNVKAQYPNGTMCGYFLNATSQDPVLMSGYLVNADGSPGETLLMRTLPLTTIFDYKPLYGNGSINFKKSRNSITDVLIVSAVEGSATNVHQKIPPVAQECVLKWCVKTIRSSYDSGQYSEEILHTFQNTTEGPPPWISVPFWTDFESGTDNVYLQNISINLGPTLEGRNISGYGTSNESASSIVASFQDIFPAFFTTSNPTAQPMMRWRTWQAGPAWNRILDFNPWLAPNNVTQHMERLATAMTNVVRSAPSKTMLKGHAYTKETFISIKWAWLAFPFILLLLSLVFLIATMIKTSKDGDIGMWKTSAMPTLISSLPEDIQKELLNSGKNDDASRKGARKVRIKLLPDQGWRVSGQLRTSPITRGMDQNGPPGWI